MKVSFRECFERAASQSSYDGGLAKRSRKTYWGWLLAFAKFTGKRASEWRSSDVSAWMHRLDRERKRWRSTAPTCDSLQSAGKEFAEPLQHACFLSLTYGIPGFEVRSVSDRCERRSKPVFQRSSGLLTPFYPFPDH